MKIVAKQSGKHAHFSDGQSIFIFEFDSKEDYDTAIDMFYRYTQEITEDNDLLNKRKTYFNQLIEKISSRNDNKYARNGVFCSSMLFAEEMADFSILLIILSQQIYNESLKEQIDLQYEMLGLYDEKLESLEDQINLKKELLDYIKNTK